MMTTTVAKHPCFEKDAKSSCARIHLPVAPTCNVQCNFCDRKYDCVNESRPGVTSAILNPQQAIVYLDRVMAREGRITTVGIAGPGDPMATPDTTIETLRLVKQRWPEMLLCLASNGLGMPSHVPQLARIGVTHCTITINAVDPAIGSHIYAWVRPGRFALRGLAAAETLLECQLEALRLLKNYGIAVKINSILLPGINDHHMGQIARTVASMGADRFNCIPLLPTAGTPFGELPAPDETMIHSSRLAASMYLPQMEHCTRCRSDAVGILGQDRSGEFAGELQRAAGLHTFDTTRPYVAVASWEGMLINQHLGEAQQLWIFNQSGDGYEHVETREAPASGGGEGRWDAMADLLADCRCILVNGVGERPRAVLRNRGIDVLEVEGVIEEGLHAAYETNDFSRLLVRKKKACQAGCTGTGGGCG